MKPFTSKQLEKAVTLYNKGKSFAQVAEKFNLKASTMWSRLKDKVDRKEAEPVKVKPKAKVSKLKTK